MRLDLEMNIKKPSLLETIAGSPLMQSLLTALATLGAVSAPFSAPHLPVLANSLATERHKKRVDDTLQELNDLLAAQEETVRNLSDNQYKLVNEVILTIMQTTEQEKLQYLRQVVINGTHYDEMDAGETVQVTRILRDISAAELSFVTDRFAFRRIVFDVAADSADTLSVKVQSREGQLVSGLIALGIVVPCASTIDDTGMYQFSPVTAKLLAVLQGQP